MAARSIEKVHLQLIIMVGLLQMFGAWTLSVLAGLGAQRTPSASVARRISVLAASNEIRVVMRESLMHQHEQGRSESKIVKIAFLADWVALFAFLDVTVILAASGGDEPLAWSISITGLICLLAPLLVWALGGPRKALGLVASAASHLVPD